MYPTPSDHDRNQQNVPGKGLRRFLFVLILLSLAVIIVCLQCHSRRYGEAHKQVGSIRLQRQLLQLLRTPRLLLSQHLLLMLAWRSVLIHISII